MSKTKFLVIRDTREKKRKGWIFSSSDLCLGTQTQKLDTGDYTLLGYENVICIERKGSIMEFAHNLIEPRFFKELERLNKFTHSFILLEFSLPDLIDYPYCDAVPFYLRKKIRVGGAFLLAKLCEIQLTYKFPILFCGNSKYAKTTALSIFKRITE